MKFICGAREFNIETDHPVLVSDIIKKARLDFSMPCGGRGKCGKCRVRVTGGVSEPTGTELAFLTREEINKGIRLACMTTVTGNAAIDIPQESGGDILSDFFAEDITLDPVGKNYGVALDIGTTTVAGYLIDLSSGKVLEKCVRMNPQRPYGADVISRINFALDGNLRHLQSLTADCINGIIGELCPDRDMIDCICAAGNTAMLYLLSGRDPSSISAAPFKADSSFGEYISPADIGINCGNAEMYLISTVSAFVGADTVAAVISSGIYKSGDTSLLIDIGTNGEIVLAHSGRLYACSAAAGPAFEGAGLSMGMTAVDGAIKSVNCDGKAISFTTVGNAPAKGICGSGIIDAAAVMLQLGIMDNTGLIKTSGHDFTDFVSGEEGSAEFIIPGSDIKIAQADIRNIQLGKAAAAAGIKTLLHAAGLSCPNVSSVYLAGGFGNYMNADSAVSIGLLPLKKDIKKYSIGNAAACGAALMLLNKSLFDYSGSLAGKVETVELSTDPYFADEFIKNMTF
ncbi:MAG: ASKHA domain-containing protein [Clostridiales bacterium]|nr:ASKHA domain-containing protein [Clostridiales bacterium]